ncbi:MAG: hypothetical protein ACAH83_08720 [Alphaproteobacteria bacterium]
MAFRAEESAQSGFDEVRNYLISRNIDASQRSRSETKLREIVEEYGPVIDAYPSWHPLVTHHEDDGCPVTEPSERCGYKGLDHTRYFLNAFITCPYGDGKEIMASVEALAKRSSSVATIAAERLDVQFYSASAHPILVYCDWANALSNNSMIPASLAVPLMLEKEMPCREGSTYGETWETMRPYFLGSPHGSRSSLFVSQETALTMKKIWELIINTEMFGPVRA